mgnify:FL=1
MMNNNRLVLAFAEVERREIGRLPSDDKIVWKPSAEFERKMAKLLKEERTPLWQLINTRAKRAVCIVLVILAALGASMSIKAVREPVVRFFVEIYEAFARITHPQQSETTIETAYALPGDMLPEGYELSYERSSPTFYSEEYTIADGKTIYFCQAVIASTNITIDKEGTSALEIFVGTYEGRYYKSKNTINLIWSDGTYLFNMIAPDTFEIGELVRLAENLREK